MEQLELPEVKPAKQRVEYAKPQLNYSFASGSTADPQLAFVGMTTTQFARERMQQGVNFWEATKDVLIEDFLVLVREQSAVMLEASRVMTSCLVR